MNPTESPLALCEDSVHQSVARPPVAIWPKPVAVALTLVGVALPLFCFLISFPERPDWQSGTTEAYAQLLLSHKCSAPLYPFLLYSMVCLVLVVWMPSRFAGRLLVRWGIYCGVLVAAEFWLIFQLALPNSGRQLAWQVLFSVLAVLVPWCGWRLGVFLHRRGFGATPLVLSAGTIIATVLAAVFGTSEAIGAAIFICLWCSTPWALSAYATVAIGFVRGCDAARLRFSLAQLFALVGALAAHLAAWRLSFVWMLEEYAKLPLTKPGGCFVCSAVANGHATVVHSEAWLMSDGTTCRVSDQLRTLKAFELLLVAISPGFHRRCRWVYNRIGPRAAALLCHPLLADAGYFLLKPPEWFARVCLAVAIPGQMRLVRELYRATP
jgi:hypothetical protein